MFEPVNPRLILASLLALCVTLQASESAAHLVPDGEPMQVNNTSAEVQHTCRVAYSGDGGSRVAVWASKLQDGDSYGVFARFGDDPIDVPVNLTTTGWQGGPDASMSETGTTVIVWSGDDPDDDSIYARIFDNGGGPITGEFLVETLAGHAQQARVEHFPNGNFAVVWHFPLLSQSMMKVFDPVGNGLSSHLLITQEPGHQAVDIAVSPEGVGVVSWRQTGANPGVFYQLFDDTGQWITGTLQANQDPMDGYGLNTASATIGAFFLGWARHNADQTRSIRCRAFDLTGAPIDSEKAIAELPDETVAGLSMSHDALGRGVIAWDRSPGSVGDVYAQCLQNDTPVESPVIVNTSSDSRHRSPCVDHDNRGRVAVVWNVEGANAECFLQTYDLGGVASADDLPVDELPVAAALELVAQPSVFTQETSLRLTLPEASLAKAAVFDAQGRSVRHFPAGDGATPVGVLAWDGRDQHGNRLPAGAYWVHARTESGAKATARVVLLR